jgi:hypothetical protein
MSSNQVYKTFLFRFEKILFCQLQLFIFGRMGKDGTTTLSISTLSIMTLTVMTLTITKHRI